MKIGNYNFEKKDFGWLVFILILALCFSIAGYFVGREYATEVLSIVSTAISIVLSIVAILYTLISGSNSSSVNAETKAVLENIDTKLLNLEHKINQKQQVNIELEKRVAMLENLKLSGKDEKKAVSDMIDSLSKWIDD